MTPKEKFLREFSTATEEDYAFIAIQITVPDCPEPELIIFPRENFEEKRRFYSKAYTDDLVHSMNKEVMILGIVYSTRFEEIIEMVNESRGMRKIREYEE